MKLGPAWLVIEEKSDGTDSLLSVISPRRTFNFVADFVTQMVVDRHATFEEKIDFKKNRKSWPYPAIIESGYQGNIWSNVQPLIKAHYCQNLQQQENTLFYTYKIIEDVKVLNPVFKSITKSLEINEP